MINGDLGVPFAAGKCGKNADFSPLTEKKKMQIFPLKEKNAEKCGFPLAGWQLKLARAAGGAGGELSEARGTTCMHVNSSSAEFCPCCCCPCCCWADRGCLSLVAIEVQHFLPCQVLLSEP